MNKDIEINYDEIDPLIRSIIYKLNKQYDVKTFYCCQGHLQNIDTWSPYKRPYIVIEGTTSNLEFLKQISFKLGISYFKLNSVISSKFDIRTADLQWLFQIPESMYEFKSNLEIESFWIRFEYIMDEILTKPSKTVSQG